MNEIFISCVEIAYTKDGKKNLFRGFDTKSSLEHLLTLESSEFKFANITYVCPYTQDGAYAQIVQTKFNSIENLIHELT